MKSPFQSLLTQRPLWRLTAVWLVGLFLLGIGLSACGSQTKDSLPTPAAPAVIPAGAGSGANGQTVTGFNIDGWF